MVVSKDKLRQDGIPAGLGIPRQRLTEEEYRMMQAIEEDDMEQAGDIAYIQALKDAPQYDRGEAYGDRGKFLQQAGKLEPFKYKPIVDPKTGKVLKWQVTEGDIPEEMMIDFPILGPTVSFTCLDTQGIQRMNDTFSICRTSGRFFRSREAYTPYRNAMEDNAEGVFYAKVNQSFNGILLQEASTQRVTESKRVDVSRSRGFGKNILDRVRGKE
jgi:hypothetical protein